MAHYIHESLLILYKESINIKIEYINDLQKNIIYIYLFTMNYVRLWKAQLSEKNNSNDETDNRK